MCNIKTCVCMNYRNVPGLRQEIPNFEEHAVDRTYSTGSSGCSWQRQLTSASTSRDQESSLSPTLSYRVFEHTANPAKCNGR